MPANNPGRVAVKKNQFEFRTTVPDFVNGTSENGFATDPTGSLRGSGGLYRRRSANNPSAVAGQPAGAQSTDKSKTNATKFQKAVEALKQAKDEEARKKSLETLSEVVSQLFDEDLKRRESEVGDIRNRAAKLKAIVDKRKESKDRIVDLQLKIQLNEVEGLGFSAKRSSGRRNGNSYASGLPGMWGLEVIMVNPIQYPQMTEMAGAQVYGGGGSTESADPRR